MRPARDDLLQPLAHRTLPDHRATGYSVTAYKTAFVIKEQLQQYQCYTNAPVPSRRNIDLPP